MRHAMNKTKDEETNKSWLDKLGQLLYREPQDRNQLVEILRDAQSREVLDSNSLAMLEGVILFAELKVRDIMIPRSQMVAIPQLASLEEIFKIVVESGHSRFPMMADNKDEVIGILHAKDLLKFRLQDEEAFNLSDLIRPATIVPESKRLDLLLTEFRNNRNHMAIVVDEYGGVSGFVTIEDIIEQIIGDIEDEFDIDEDAFIKQHKDGSFIIKAHMPIEEFNEQLSTKFEHHSYDTISGILIKELGHLPKPGECITINNLEFKILNADSRRIKLIECKDRRNISIG
jgi:magnesium and cobalt transporter